MLSCSRARLDAITVAVVGRNSDANGYTRAEPMHMIESPP